MYDSIVNAINGVGDFIGDVFSSVLDFFVAVYEILVNVSSFIISALGFIWFAGKTLVVGVAKLIWYVLDGPVFVDVQEMFIKLSDYIGGPGAIFLSAILMIAIVRIIIAFILKIFRRSLDYQVRKTKWSKGLPNNREPTDYVEDVSFPRLEHK